MAELTTTSYASLGLLNIKPWSAYELTQQAQRSLRYLWPKSESHLYAELKRLVRMGFARVTRRLPPARFVHVRCTESPPLAGAPSNAGWRASQHPPTRVEAALRLFYAYATNKDAVLAAFDAHEKSSNSATPKECCYLTLG